jgi:hypothetical protein
MITTSTSPEAGTAPSAGSKAGTAANAAEPARKERRLIVVIVSKWFPEMAYSARTLDSPQIRWFTRGQRHVDLIVNEPNGNESLGNLTAMTRA